MLDAFHLGGWGMYPTTIAGLILLFSAVQYARHPEAGRLRLVRALSALTLLSSVLGFVTGVIKAFTSIKADMAPDIGWVVVVGVGESLVNIGAGLVILVMATIITTFGVARSRTTSADLADPHAP